MGFTTDTIKQTLLGFISSQAAVSEKYTTIQNAFTRTRKITFSDAMLATISLQKDHSKNELLNYFSFSESSPTLSALIQQRSKISPTAFESLFYSFSGAFDFKRTLKGYELLAVDGSDIYLPFFAGDRHWMRLQLATSIRGIFIAFPFQFESSAVIRLSAVPFTRKSSIDFPYVKMYFSPPLFLNATQLYFVARFLTI